MRHALPSVAAIAAVLGSSFLVQAADAAEYATVVSSTPVIASVPVSRQVCSDGQQLVQERPSGAGAVIGAIAGGVLGHTVGGGFGRAAATGVGAVAGAVVGDRIEANTSPVAEVPVRRCQTATTYESRTVGYDVMYEYNGQRYSTRMARDPGKRMAINVQPADATATPVPAPAYSQPVPQTDAVSTAPQPAYYDPLPPAVYYPPASYYPPTYYTPGPAVYIAPAIGFGFGYYGGYRHRHWR